MGLSSALSIAGSGLRTTQTWAEITSRNIANATTEDYVRKDTQVSTIQGGVQVSSVQREVSAMLERLDRAESAKLSRWQTVREALDVYTGTLGQPDDETSPAARLNDFQESLNALANMPGSAALQGSVLETAHRLTASLNDASAMLDEVAREVELGIRYDVADVNERLSRIAALNERILRTQPDSLENAEMRDALAGLVDEVAGYLDVQITQSPDGRINLYTAGGTALIEGRSVHPLSYDAATGTLLAGAQPVTPATPGVRGFSDGSLGGLFQLRNEVLPRFNLQLDEMARAMIESFTAADASLPPGAPGLFTDAQAAFVPANLDGLAGRIEVNAAVDPAQGGTLSRLRDGVGAVAPGPSGDPTQIQDFIAVFSQTLAFDPATGIGAAMTPETYATGMVSAQHTTRTDAQAEYAAIAISAETIAATRRNTEGVNTDDELQKLMLIEQSYAANARMMTTVSNMMDALLAAV